MAGCECPQGVDLEKAEGRRDRHASGQGYGTDEQVGKMNMR
jgi:hypothetical protein